MVPEFPEGLDWINTGGASVRIAELRGRVVLLDFWTYGCINCRHLQPRLRELERRFADTLTVIGVHSGKFVHERVTDNLAAACDRQGVRHAVVNDRQLRVWRMYGVNAWPTVALIGAEGRLLGIQAGEFPLEPMAKVIEAAVQSARDRGILMPGPDPAARPGKTAGGDLRFPGRVVVDADRLLIADTGHGRVLDCALTLSDRRVQAAVRAVHGGFSEPQGLALHGDDLYVADRADQAVWRIGRLGERERVLGTGELADGTSRGGRGPSVAVRSPWGLTRRENALLVGMAGSHQLWRLDLSTLEALPWAGTGGEELVDGPLDHALLAQPTGVCTVGATVAFADCESSAIRLANAETGVRTLVGRGLFHFGDRDGVGEEALLEHAEDLAYFDGALAVVDTYNNRLKRVDPETRETGPWEGEVGEKDALREPAGVSSDGASLFIADTGNHRVVRVGGGGHLTAVEIQDLVDS
jgi:thiol-disulfide isomerase/thioredoxin